MSGAVKPPSSPPPAGRLGPVRHKPVRRKQAQQKAALGSRRRPSADFAACYLSPPCRTTRDSFVRIAVVRVLRLAGFGCAGAKAPRDRLARSPRAHARRYHGGGLAQALPRREHVPRRPPRLCLLGWRQGVIRWYGQGALGRQRPASDKIRRWRAALAHTCGTALALGGGAGLHGRARMDRGMPQMR